MKKVLEIKNYSLALNVNGLLKQAVNNIDLYVEEGEAVALVGESGCGKSLTALSIAGLTPKKSQVLSGEILLNQENVLSYHDQDWRRVRGNEVSMIFQEPMTALDPLYKVGLQIEEASTIHGLSRKKARVRAQQLMEKVGFNDIDKVYKMYPHQLSGGMRQRILICIALMESPTMLIADEPTTALDAMVQRQVLYTMKDVSSSMNTSLLFISHDLDLVSQVCRRVYVMYQGKIVESGLCHDILVEPSHPYTRDLLSSMPSIHKRGKELPAIKGSVPSLESRKNKGCPFAPRCKQAMPICLEINPPNTQKGTRKASCHLLKEENGWIPC